MSESSDNGEALFAHSTSVYVLYRKNAPECANRSPQTFEGAFLRRADARRWAQKHIGVNSRAKEVFEIVRAHVPVHCCD
jgi:hypothetical protein